MSSWDMCYMQKWGAIKKNKNLTTSRQSRKLIFSIQPYLTKLDKICKNHTEKSHPEGFLLAYNQSTKINPIGCDTIVNSPSRFR